MSECQNSSRLIDIIYHTEVENGLDYLLRRFSQPLFPRTISTKSKQGKQVIVSSREEALAWFKASNYEDCRISAYPYWRPSKVSEFVGIRNSTAPDFIMIDYDRRNFKTDRALKLTLSTTLKNIRQKLSSSPTVIWSGNGYHIYIPITAVILEDIKQFNGEDQITTKFLRFTECYLSGGKSDPSHNNTVSINNLLCRVPGSINSKSNTSVVIVRRWDTTRPNINLLIGSFCAHLTAERLKVDLTSRTNNYTNPNNNNKIYWIESLLQRPLDDHRKFLVWMVLPQYLVNIKRLSVSESNDIIRKWLDACNKLRPLDTNATKQKLKEGFNAAEDGFKPMSLYKLKKWKPGLYDLLFEEKYDAIWTPPNHGPEKGLIQH